MLFSAIDVMDQRTHIDYFIGKDENAFLFVLKIKRLSLRISEIYSKLKGRFVLCGFILLMCYFSPLITSFQG